MFTRGWGWGYGRGRVNTTKYMMTLCFNVAFVVLLYDKFHILKEILHIRSRSWSKGDTYFHVLNNISFTSQVYRVRVTI